MQFFKALKQYIKSEIFNWKKNHKIKLITLLTLLLSWPILIFIMIISFILGIIISLFPGKIEYDKSLYKKITNNHYLQTVFDKGLSAEYFTWKVLNEQEEYKKILINIYVPCENHLTEIDSILINKYGIFVIESKGYSGWIFGTEINMNWKQVIYKNTFEFYNPIIQNRTHILALSKILEINDMTLFRSYVVFSERCELKKIQIKKPNIKVIKRHSLNETLNKDYQKYGEVLTQKQIDIFYEKLIKYMAQDSEVKEKHIKYVKSFNKNGQ